MSRIVTFYSYKGGVGRTLALANIGVLLAKLGKRVLLMDWDLEAPGLDRYFAPYLQTGFSPGRGVVHLLHEAAENPSCDWHPHVQEVTVRAENTSTEASYRLSIIPSGVASSDYGRKVRSFSWTTFMEEKNGGPTLERWRDEWKSEFDFVLIDSRTGITDTGGICTVLLPDVLVLVFTANDQSFEGALGITENAQVERRHLAVQRPPLTILPLLSRFDGRKETDLAEEWLKRFNVDLKPLVDDWLPKQFQPRQIIELTKIPYVTRFSFGEPLPVLTHSLTDPEFPGFYLDNSARLLSSDFKDAARIIDPESTDADDTSAQIRALIGRAPLDEMELTRLTRVAERELGESPELAQLLSDISGALYQQARWQTAEPLIRRALLLDQRNFGQEHPTVAIRLSNLAQLLMETNRFAEAEPLTRRALAIDEQSYGSEHPNVAIRLNNLAQVLQETNRLAEAEPLMRRALAIDEQNYGPEHSTVAIDLNNLAQVLQDTNRLAEAEPLMQRALAIAEQNYGPEHPTVAVNLNNLAQLLQDTNRLAEAEPLIRRALAIDEQSYGSEHPNVGIRLNNLALLLLETNRLAEAEPLMQRALAIAEQNYGPEHPHVAVDLNNLAQLLQQTNRFVEAEPLMRRALTIDEQSYGSEHPKVAVRLNNLAQLLQNTNRSTEAEPLARRALEIFKVSSQGSAHHDPRLQVAVDNYKGLLEEMGMKENEIQAKLDALGVSEDRHTTE